MAHIDRKGSLVSSGVIYPLASRLISAGWWASIGLSPLDMQFLPPNLCRPAILAPSGEARFESRLIRASRDTDED